MKSDSAHLPARRVELLPHGLVLHGVFYHGPDHAGGHVAAAVSRQKDGSLVARWVLLEGEEDAWSVTFRRVPHDIEAAARWTEQHAHQGAKEAAQLRPGKSGKTA